MKFKDLIFLAEMDYSQIPGEHSQAVRDATLGEEPGEGEFQYKFVRTKYGTYIEPAPEGEFIVDGQLVKYMGKPYMVYLNFNEKDISHESDRDIASGERYTNYYYIGDMNDVEFKGFAVHPDSSATPVTDPALIKALKEEGLNVYFEKHFNERDYGSRHSDY